jgi:hypothetical protein
MSMRPSSSPRPIDVACGVDQDELRLGSMPTRLGCQPALA